MSSDTLRGVSTGASQSNQDDKISHHTWASYVPCQIIYLVTQAQLQDVVEILNRQPWKTDKNSECKEIRNQQGSNHHREEASWASREDLLLINNNSGAAVLLAGCRYPVKLPRIWLQKFAFKVINPGCPQTTKWGQKTWSCFLTLDKDTTNPARSYRFR